MRKKFNVTLLVLINVFVFIVLLSAVLKQQPAENVNTGFTFIGLIFIFIGGLQALFTFRFVKKRQEQEDREPSTLERLRSISKAYEEENTTYDLEEDETFDELLFREEENKRMMKNYRYCKHCGEGLEDSCSTCPRCGEENE